MDRLRRGQFSHSPELGAPPLSIKRLLRKLSAALRDLFLTCTVWRQTAENAAESLQRGMRVIVTGRLKQRGYETKEGEKRTVYELEVDEVGPSLRSATVKVTKAARSGAGPDKSVTDSDPWATAGPGRYSDEASF